MTDCEIVTQRAIMQSGCKVICRKTRASSPANYSIIMGQCRAVIRVTSWKGREDSIELVGRVAALRGTNFMSPGHNVAPGCNANLIRIVANKCCTQRRGYQQFIACKTVSNRGYGRNDASIFWPWLNFTYNLIFNLRSLSLLMFFRW